MPTFDRDALPSSAQDQVDTLLTENRRVMAIKVVRDSVPPPSPGVRECMDLISERYAALGLPVDPPPSPPLSPEALSARVDELTGPAHRDHGRMGRGHPRVVSYVSSPS